VKQQLDLIAQLREAMRRAKVEADDAVRRNAISSRAGNHGKLTQQNRREKISGLHQKTEGH
jgi:hypothetical protein